MKKLAYISIGAVFTLVVSFSWITWADSTNSAAESSSPTAPQTKGEQTSTAVGEISLLDPTAGSIIVFDGQQKHSFKTDTQTKVLINQKEDQLSKLHLGDQVEVVCNSDGLVRYVVQTKESVSTTQPATSAVSNNQSTIPAATPAPLTQNKGTVELKQEDKVKLPADKEEKWLEKYKSPHDNGKHKGWSKDKKHEEDDQGEDHDD